MTKDAVFVQLENRFINNIFSKFRVYSERRLNHIAMIGGIYGTHKLALTMQYHEKY